MVCPSSFVLRGGKGYRNTYQRSADAFSGTLSPHAEYIPLNEHTLDFPSCGKARSGPSRSRGCPETIAFWFVLAHSRNQKVIDKANARIKQRPISRSSIVCNRSLQHMTNAIEFVSRRLRFRPIPCLICANSRRCTPSWCTVSSARAERLNSDPRRQCLSLDVLVDQLGGRLRRGLAVGWRDPRCPGRRTRRPRLHRRHERKSTRKCSRSGWVRRFVVD